MEAALPGAAPAQTPGCQHRPAGKYNICCLILHHAHDKPAGQFNHGSIERSNIEVMSLQASALAHLVLLQALEERLLNVVGVRRLLGVGWVCGHAEAHLLLLAPGCWVDGQDVLPAQGLRVQCLDLLQVLHLWTEHAAATNQASK